MLRTIRRISTTTIVTGLLTAGYAGVGCSRTAPAPMASTAGELVEQRADAMKQKGELIQKGERMIADGRAMVARGEAIRDQGNALEGKNLVIDGEAKIRQGENYKTQADAVVLPSTQPSARYSERDRTTIDSESANNRNKE